MKNDNKLKCRQPWCERTGNSVNVLLRHARGSSLHRRADAGDEFVPWPNFNSSAVNPNCCDHSALDEIVLTRDELDMTIIAGIKRVVRYNRILSSYPGRAAIMDRAQEYALRAGQHTDAALLELLERFTHALHSAVYRDNHALLLAAGLSRSNIYKRGYDVGGAYQDFHMVMALLDRRLEPETFNIPPPHIREIAANDN